MVLQTMQCLDMAERKEAREVANPLASRVSQGESFLGERDCGEALRPGESTRGSSQAYFWLDGTRQNNNGFISKLVKQH